MRNTGTETSFQAGDVKAELHELPLDKAKFDLTFAVQESGAGLALQADYRPALYERDTVARMVGHLYRILSEASRNPEIAIGDIPMLGPEERNTLLKGFNPDPTPLPSWPTVCRPISGHAQQRPEHRAVVAEDGILTYKELESLANRTARAIHNSGAGRDSIVAVVADRSTWPVVGMLAALKAGAGYVGLDVNYPREHKEFILRESQSPCLVGTSDQLAKLDFSGPKIALDGELPLDNTDPGLAHGGNDLAYAIFTSGSTGKPKGVLLEHRSMVNFIDWYSTHHGMQPESNCAAFAAFSFDVSVVQIFAPLVSGATLHVVPERLRRSPQELDEYFIDNSVTHAHFPTQFAEMFMQLCSCKSLQYMVVGGDRLKSYRLDEFRLTNEYGPSETTMACLSYDLPDIVPHPPVGSPVANNRVYILDSHGQLCPLGVPGEICVAGEGVGRGYLNREDLTAQKFVQDPFVPTERMFLTGDKGRWRNDGNVDFIGRKDFQVKIRGYRVEPGEIEFRIKDTGMVRECVVVALEEPGGDKALGAYCVSGTQVDESALKQLLREVLPEYMIPSYVVQLESMPLNPNGKIDRGKLPRPEITSGGSGPLEPRNPKESRIASAWSSVLGHRGFGLLDSFFEVGGDSLKAISLLADLSETFDISASDVFAYTSIAEQAENFQEAEVGRCARLLRLKSLASPPDPDPHVQEEEQRYQQALQKDSGLDTQTVAFPEHVLLTGASGTLGVYLLHELLESTPAKVSAIVRARDPEEAYQRLADPYREHFQKELSRQAGDRLQVLSGDLSQASLGLQEGVGSQLEREVDAILHSAALTSHYGDWESFQAANIASVQNLIDFARRGQTKSLHNVSTTSIGAGRVQGRSQVVFTEFDLDMGQEAGNYYVRSKLEAEKLLQRAREQGMEVNIYRAGNITCDSNTGMFQSNVEDNAFFQQLRAYVNLGAAPDKLDSRNMTYVDQSARAIVELISRPGLRGETFHVQNPHQLSLSRALTDDSLGLRLSRLAFEEFVEFLSQHAAHTGFQDYIERLLLHLGWQEWLADPGKTATFIRVDRTAKILERLGFTWKEPSALDLKRFVTRALQDRVDMLRDTAGFRHLAEEGLLDLAANLRPESFAAERTLQQENRPVDGIRFVLDGMVETYRHSASGWIGTVRVGGPGSCVGEEAVPEDSQAINSVESLGDVFALQIPPVELRKQIRKHPDLGMALLKNATVKVNQAERLFVAQ